MKNIFFNDNSIYLSEKLDTRSVPSFFLLNFYAPPHSLIYSMATKPRNEILSQTDNLSLPYILPSQAQKHITHNEALLKLDAIVQLSVESRNLTEPPVTPDDGARYLIPVSAAGDFVGQTGKIAAFQDGVFQFFEAQTGWLCYITDEAIWLYFDGNIWTELINADANFDQIGINTSADTTNRLSLSSPASLFNNSGNGHQLKINKAAAPDNASLLFQTGFSGRAEFGLSGDDQFRIKISADGSSFTTALTANVARIDANLPLGLMPYNVANLPSPSPAGQMIYVSDAATGAIVAFSDNTGWRRSDTRAIVT